MQIEVGYQGNCGIYLLGVSHAYSELIWVFIENLSLVAQL